MDRLILCTGNPGKIAELRALLPVNMELLTLNDAGLPVELPETGNSFAANALQKARFAHERTGLPCIADDSGLEVDALGGAPGVDTAFYAGPQKSDKDNVGKLLLEMHGKEDRTARFRTVIALVDAGSEHLFEGEVRGKIAFEARGTNGFGYDPVFIPEGTGTAFAEMDAMVKNAISHRARAVRKLVQHLSGS